MKTDRLTRPLLRSLLLAAAVAVAPATMTSCVDDVGLIDRTSPDKISKTLFEGVWLYVQTTVDVPFSSAVSFTGEMNFGESQKIVFDIQEDYLVAHSVVETVHGTEADFKTHKVRKYWDPDNRDQFVEMYLGPPVARWPITGHFDVIRNYNSYNGSQSNEVVENSTDRPWYERDHIRIDWNQQGVRAFFYSLGGGVGSDSYFVGEDKPESPDSVVMDPEGGYFDYVVRTLAWSTGQNRCSTYGLSAYDCAKTEVKVRHSFKRLDHTRDYEPIRYHNNEHQEYFGYFLTERNAYNLDWGSTYEGKISFANRWNLWLDNYTYQRPTNTEGTELEITCFRDLDCNRAVGERCQKTSSWFGNGYCAAPQAKPYKDRTLKPVVYHLNADWHEDYMAEAYLAADNWSEAFKDAVAWALFYEKEGQAKTRGCDTHADCAVDTLRADADVPVQYSAVACHSAAECSGNICAADGFCAAARTCDTNNPCAVGQVCSGGECQVNGTTVVETLKTTTTRGSTVIYFGTREGTEATTIVTHDNFTTSKLQALPANHSYVRFVNADPNGGSLGLSVTGGGVDVQIKGGAFSAGLDYDPQDPATADFMASIAPATGVTFTITQNGAPTAKTISGDIAAQTNYLIVYAGDRPIILGASFPESAYGIRFLHASVGEAPVNFGVEGVRLEETTRTESAGNYQFNRRVDFSYGQATSYVRDAGNMQRATVTSAGSRGDVTCYRADGIGRCVGWGKEITDTDKQWVVDTKKMLPEMFLLCENVYDELAATDQGNITDRKGDARYTLTCAGSECEEAYSRFGYVGHKTLQDTGIYNPCGDPELIPQPAQAKKIGDIRYSYFYWINEPQRSGPLGYGPSAADPDTGEIITATANIYGGAIHTYSQYAGDLLRLVNGDLDTEDVIIGEHIREYMATRGGYDLSDTETFFAALSEGEEAQDGGEAIEQGAMNPERDQAARSQAKGLTEAKHLHAHTADISHLVTAQGVPKRHYQPHQFPELVEYMRNPEKLRADLQQQFPPLPANFYQDRLEKIRGTWIEDLLINDEVMLGAPFVDPEGEMTQDELRAALSPVSWGTKTALRSEEERVRRLSRQNLYMGEFVDDALFGLAKDLKEAGFEGAKLNLEVGRKILQGVLEHEVGHTVGLRHNFSGSTDVFNFFDEYYDIREKDFVLCQEDGWCDDIGGESCPVQGCTQDSDCLTAAQLCINNFCSAPDATNPAVMIGTGVCSRQVGTQACTSNAQCAQVADGAVCAAGLCYTPSLQFVPRPEMTFNEKAERRTEYQYSTVMDYGGRLNSDIHGLGKYDRAAIRFGYTGLIDVYEDTSSLKDRVQEAALRTGSTPATYSFFMNTQFWPNRGTGFWHAFNYLTNYIGVEGNKKRLPVPYEQVRHQQNMVDNDVRESLDYAYLTVPYAMCSDEYRGNMGCYYFDHGIDPGEMAAGARTQLEQYYIFDAFKRERLFFGDYGNPMAYYGRIMDRYLRVLGDVGQYYAMWDNFLFRYSWYDQWKLSPLGGATLSQAAIDSFGYLKDAVSSPAPGCYALAEGEKYYQNTSFYQEPGTPCDLYVPFGVGRFPYTQFSGALGYDAARHPMWFGSFWEKYAALQTLTDSTAYFVDLYVGESLGAGTSLGYNTVFAEEMTNFLGGIVVGDLDFYAGRVASQSAGGQVSGYVGPSVPGRISCRDVSASDLSSCHPSVEPALNNFTLRLYSALLGLAYIPAGYDPQFIDRMAVFVEGEGAHYEHAGAPGVIQRRFNDPIGGKVYVAYTTNYGSFEEDPKVDVGATLVQRGQELADRWAQATGVEKTTLGKQIQDLREILDVLRSLHQSYGHSTLGL